ncbi:protease-associated domain-containing protein 1 [Aplysia californica]|uniref:Protease-associated domain-containing protein 1 n=1 Tax=Aplysia californica TaxID=6500 RepID=A0ABM0JCD0_APLCA|nr:protease-associated domain-containing protein 1 [Aplysia californica]
MITVRNMHSSHTLHRFICEHLRLFCCTLIILAAYVSSLDISTVPDEIVLVEDSLFFEILWPESLMYTYQIRQAKDFGTNFDRVYNKIDMVIADPVEGCQALNNDVKDVVVFILRGECSFLTKTKVAERAGAIAVIIADNDETNDGNMIDMIDDSTERSTSIPSSFLMGKDGLMIRQRLSYMGTDRAIITIPLNLTGKPFHENKRPPWTLW